MRILVTGARGFIGRNLVKYFSRNHAVVGCGREKLDLLEPSRVERFLKRGKFDLVIHAANYDANSPVVERDPTVAFEINLRMFSNLIRCHWFYKQLIYFGSGAEVDKEHRKLHMDETDFKMYPPTDSYGLSKWFMNRVPPYYNRKVINVRLLGVFGEDDDWRYRVIPNLCAQALYFDKLVLKRNAVHDFMYINDLGPAIDNILGYGPLMPDKSYNVCPGNPVTFRRLAEIVRDVSGRKLKIECPKKIFHSFSGSNHFFRGRFHDFRFTPMEIAIKSLYEWYSDHRDEIPKDEVMKWL